MAAKTIYLLVTRISTIYEMHYCFDVSLDKWSFTWKNEVSRGKMDLTHFPPRNSIFPVRNFIFPHETSFIQ